MKPEIFRKSKIVKQEDIDHLNHVNNVVFLKWVQEIAGDHWNSKNLTEFDNDHYWVVIDHYIKYSGEAFKGDKLKIQTYVEHIGGVRSIRIVEFYKDDKLIVVAKTNWCLLNRLSKKPARIPIEVVNLFV